MKALSTSILLLALLSQTAEAIEVNGTGTADLSWTEPTTNTDGSPLTDLAGYNLKWGINNACSAFPNSLPINNPLATTTTQTFTLSSTGTFEFCFVMTALDGSGNESVNSNTATRTFVVTIPDILPPAPPTNIIIDMQFTCVTDVVGQPCEITIQ